MPAPLAAPKTPRYRLATLRALYLYSPPPDKFFFVFASFPEKLEPRPLVPLAVPACIRTFTVSIG